MTLRIPLSPDQTLQTEFHEIERRLRKLEKTTGTTASSSVRVVSGGGGGTTVGGGAVNLQPIYDRIVALETEVNNLPAPVTHDFGGVGPGSVHGLVPTPGAPQPPTGVAGHVLLSDGTWGFPFRGLVSVETSGAQSDPPYDVLNIAASVTLAHLGAANVGCYELWTDGLATVRSMAATTTTKTASYTATTLEHVVRGDATSANVTITLPAAATSRGLILHVKKVDASANYVRVDGNDAETVDGNATFDLLYQNENLMIQCNGTGWDVL